MIRSREDELHTEAWEKKTLVNLVLLITHLQRNRCIVDRGPVLADDQKTKIYKIVVIVAKTYKVIVI